MSITSAIVLYAVIWFIVFFIAIPIRLKTQDLGEIVPGTQAGAPEVHELKKGMDHNLCDPWCGIWGISCAVIISGTLTMKDIDIFNRMGS